jgi:peptidoglycan hydrolase-like amidase
VAAGNHMVGISAHGALKLATTYDWTWDKILKYYLTGITITKVY